MKEQRPVGFRQTVSLFALGLVLMIGVNITAVNILGALIYPWGAPSPVTMLLINDISAYALGLPLAMLIWSFLPGDAMPIKPKQPLSAGLFLGFGALTFTTGYAASFITQALLTAGGLPTEAPVDELMLQLPPWAAFLLIAVCPAVLEELVFRGFVYKKLARFGEAPFVILSGFFFATFHGNFSQMLFAFAIGCCLALIVSRTGSMVYGMMLHFLVNFLSACVVLPLMEQPWLEPVLGGWMLACAVGATVFVVRQHRGLRLLPGKDLPQKPVLAAVLNPGMILWLLMVGFMVVMSLMV